MERVCMYLRKSRADLEAEARGEGETLAKHKRALMKLAREKGLNIIRIREEIVSGESLLHRPEMQELLKEVEAGEYDAVLCMDMDRLGRGNMQEQGLILSTFQQSGTKIITPSKVYDLRNETDELMTEVQALFARQELKMITRRMQRGRVASVEEGNYIATRPPYGYNIVKDETGRYLVPHPEQALIVKQIFDWYCSGLGGGKISAQLNAMGVPSYTGKRWTAPSVLSILKNAVYIGRIQWRKKEQVKSRTPGKKRDTRTRPVEEWIDVKGKHEPLIDEATWNKAQEILKAKYHVPYHLENGIVNPLAGLIRCADCGQSMVMRPYKNQKPHILCYNRFCKNKSSRFEYIEEKLLEELEFYLKSFMLEYGERKKRDTTNLVEIKQNAVRALEKELTELESQKLKLHDLLERGIYDEDTYLERSNYIADRITATKESIERAKLDLQIEMNKEKAQQDIIPKLKNVIQLYRRLEDPATKNQLMKSVLHYVTYKKERWQRNDQFELTIVPKFR